MKREKSQLDVTLAIYDILSIRISSEYLLTKLQELKYGANTDKELTDMREKANCIYVGRKREKDSLPKWYAL